MNKLTLILLLLFQQCLLAQNKVTIPLIRDVVKKFYSTYNIEGSETPVVAFEKHGDGWYVQTRKVVDHYPVDDKKFLFYRFSEKKFRQLHLPRATAGKMEDISSYINEYDLRWFDFYPFYGYNGWYDDVIDSLEKKRRLTNDDLYGLARAYSNSAVSLLSNQFGFSPPGVQFQVALKNDCLSAEQINQYERVAQKAINNYEKLKTRDPRYKTIVGDATFNWGNEIMTHFYNLLVFANKYATQKKIPSNCYSDSVIEVAKAILGACPANAVFLSFNDNDFFPLLYAQHSLAWRRDVYVVNYNMIGLDRYISQLSYAQFDARPVSLSVDTSVYKANRNDVLLIKDSATSVQVSELTNALKGEYDDLPFIKANRLTLNLKSDQNLVPSFDLKNTVYFFKNQWVLLDMLNNSGERKICLLYKFDDQLSFLNDFLKSQDGIRIFSF